MTAESRRSDTECTFAPSLHHLSPEAYVARMEERFARERRDALRTIHRMEPMAPADSAPSFPALSQPERSALRDAVKRVLGGEDPDQFLSSRKP